MQKSMNVWDLIDFKSIDTGGQSVGNGGNGTFKGDVVNAPTVNLDPTNTADGADVHVNTGDHVKQTGLLGCWRRQRKGVEVFKGRWRKRRIKRRPESYSGHDTSKVYANTDATQINKVAVQPGRGTAGFIGGNGGDGNAALGGEVDFHLDTL